MIYLFREPNGIDTGWHECSRDAYEAHKGHVGFEVMVVNEGAQQDADRYRWLRDHVQPFKNGNTSPHAIVHICVGDHRNGTGWFELIDKVPHVGVVSLDQAIDVVTGGTHDH